MKTTQENKLYVGQKLTAVLEDAELGQIISFSEHEVVAIEEESNQVKALQTTCLRQEWGSPNIQMIHSPQEGQPTSAKEGLEVVKSIWNFVKDNRAVVDAKGTTTSVIIKDTDPLDYAHAKEGKSGNFRFWVHDSWSKKIIYIDTSFRLEGTYGAVPTKPEIPNGTYLPSVYFNVLKMKVAWGFKLNAHAEVSKPSNLGAENQVEPQVNVYAKLEVSWLASQLQSVKFVANGKKGFKLAR